VLSACGRRQVPRSKQPATKYVYTQCGVLIWEVTAGETFRAAGSPQAGDPVTLKDMESLAKGGNTEEGMLSKGLIALAGASDRASLPASEYVYTESMVSSWRLADPGSYEKIGSPQAGDPVLAAEVLLHTGFGFGQPLDSFLSQGNMARPEASFVKKAYKVDDTLQEWTEATREKPQEPLWPSIDPHHHLWERQTPHGSPIPPFVAHSFGEKFPGYSYPHSELVRDLAGNAVVGTVFIECGAEYHNRWPMLDPLQSVAESKWVQAIADSSSVPMAIVAHMDLTQGRASVERAVAAHREAAANLVGVRHSLAWHQNAPVFSRKHEGQAEAVSRSASFREGMEVLAEHGLSYDVWLFHTNLPELIDLVQACPRTQIICDHVGGPLGNKPAGFSLEALMPEWRASITELAKCDNVCIKLSGLSMPVAGFGWEQRDEPPSSEELAEAYQPFFQHCLEAFGPKRCLFASNFPVDKASGSFTTLWNSFKLAAAKLLPGDEAAQRALFYDNAVRIYRLDKPPFSLPSTSAEAEAAELSRY